MSRQKLLAVDISFFAAVALVIAGLAIAYHNPFKRELVVWSCGGNYDGLLAFAQQFEKRHGCRVHYTAAPVEYLLERAVFGTTQPDILVGRAGPGWVALEKVGKVERGPSFFAADPYVIFVASGNPLNIRSLADLGRPGVRVAGARHAMRPKGKCAAHIMEVASRKFHPGLDERWENNMGALGELKCGRGLTEPVMTGRADAAIGYMSVASYPSVRGRVETVAIHPEYIKPMTSCKATVGQCICVLRGNRHSDLAHRFHDELVGEIGRPTLEQYGYIHISSPAIKPYRFLLREVQVPRRMPPWQVYLADCLAADGIHREALRRYLTVIHVFGPGEHDAYCQYRVGELLAEQGRVAEAAAQWRRLL
ncbi:MAG: substrate-binding domain-containing protein, partial [Armatimonadetes bacterium]|nr:substrate-binding domain-containing protein [Armatimonadota bacterium]